MFALFMKLIKFKWKQIFKKHFMINSNIDSKVNAYLKSINLNLYFSSVKHKLLYYVKFGEPSGSENSVSENQG